MNKITEFFKGFELWDFVVIFIVADLSQSFILSALFGIATWWSLFWFVLALALWKLHIWSVEHQIKNGMR